MYTSPHLSQKDTLRLKANFNSTSAPPLSFTPVRRRPFKLIDISMLGDIQLLIESLSGLKSLKSASQSRSS